MRPFGMSNHASMGGEAGEEPTDRELGVLFLVSVRITGDPCREEGADSGSKRIGVLDPSNGSNGVSVFVIALDARGDGERLGKEFRLDSSSLRLCGFNCTEEEYSMETEVVLHKEGSVTVLKRLGLC